MGEVWAEFLPSLGVAGIVAVGCAIGIRTVWNKMWERLDASEKRCVQCAAQHAEEIRSLNSELLQLLRDVRDG